MPITSSEEINLSTSLDEYAAELFISTKPGESLSDFNERVIAGQENLYLTGHEAFVNSLDYITTRRTKEVCKITIVPEDGYEVEDYSLEVNEEALVIKKEEVVEEELFYKEYKFVLQLINKLSSLTYLNVELSEDYESIKYEKSENFLRFNSQKKYVSFESSDEIIKLPVSNVVEVFDQTDMFTRLPFVDENLNAIQNDERRLLKMLIVYVENPITLKWNHINVVECNSDYFKNMLKDEHGFLTSKGANLLNQILKKQNTYWGK